MLTFENNHGQKVIALPGQLVGDEDSPTNLAAIAREPFAWEERCHPFGRSMEDILRKVELTTSSFGLLYFDVRHDTRQNLGAALALLDVCGGSKYAVFAQRADDFQQGYLTQARFVSDFALTFCFRRWKEAHPLHQPQPLDLTEGILAFVESEIRAFGSESAICEHFRIETPDSGSYGLGFGFLVEDSYHRIYRLWSRVVYYPQ